MAKMFSGFQAIAAAHHTVAGKPVLVGPLR
jgi:hypothetical protein